MGFAFKALLVLFWMGILPFLIGLLFQKGSRIHLIDSFLSGYLLMFALADVLILPMLLLKAPLLLLSVSYGALLLLCALAGVLSVRRKWFAEASSTARSLFHLPLPMYLAIALILLQMAAAAYLGHLDADDAFYVGTATTAVQTNSIFRFNAYTGNEYLNYPKRYILSPFPIFLAVMSQLCGQLHPAILAHVFFPPVFLMAAYFVMNQFAEKFLPDSLSSRGIFLFLCAVLSWFSAYSTYNAGSFMMIRIWQGKALLAAVLLPYLFLLCLSCFSDDCVKKTEEKEQRTLWIRLFLANLSCCLLSSMGIMLSPLMIGIFLLTELVQKRNLRSFLKGLLCCAPSLLFGCIYLIS